VVEYVREKCDDKGFLKVEDLKNLEMELEDKVIHL
jgi:hypothetical protein